MSNFEYSIRKLRVRLSVGASRPARFPSSTDEREAPLPWSLSEELVLVSLEFRVCDGVNRGEGDGRSKPGVHSVIWDAFVSLSAVTLQSELHGDGSAKNENCQSLLQPEYPDDKTKKKKNDSSHKKKFSPEDQRCDTRSHKKKGMRQTKLT